ncbi:hypothetical protein Tco_0502325 [Tanacetum coccineum]
MALLPGLDHNLVSSLFEHFLKYGRGLFSKEFPKIREVIHGDFHCLFNPWSVKDGTTLHSFGMLPGALHKPKGMRRWKLENFPTNTRTSLAISDWLIVIVSVASSSVMAQCWGMLRERTRDPFTSNMHKIDALRTEIGQGIAYVNAQENFNMG